MMLPSLAPLNIAVGGLPYQLANQRLVHSISVRDKAIECRSDVRIRTEPAASPHRPGLPLLDFLRVLLGSLGEGFPESMACNAEFALQGPCQSGTHEKTPHPN